MKKFSVRFVVAVLAFILGVSVAWVWSNWKPVTWMRSGFQLVTWFSRTPQTVTSFLGAPQTLPYCEVASNGEHYHNRIILVRATLFLNSGRMYIYEDCDPDQALMALVEMNGAAITDKGHYLDQSVEQGSDSSLKKFDAIVEGTFDARFSPGCWVPKYHIAATRVELLAPSTKYVTPVYNEEGMRVKH